MENFKCTQCGKETTGEAKFCVDCGALVNAVTAEDANIKDTSTMGVENDEQMNLSDTVNSQNPEVIDAQNQEEPVVTPQMDRVNLEAPEMNNMGNTANQQPIETPQLGGVNLEAPEMNNMGNTANQQQPIETPQLGGVNLEAPEMNNMGNIANQQQPVGAPQLGGVNLEKPETNNMGNVANQQQPVGAPQVNMGNSNWQPPNGGAAAKRNNTPIIIAIVGVVLVGIITIVAVCFAIMAVSKKDYAFSDDHNGSFSVEDDDGGSFSEGDGSGSFSEGDDSSDFSGGSSDDYDLFGSPGDYAEYPGVPDLGEMLGMDLVQEFPGEDGIVLYAYDVADYPDGGIEEYCAELAARGFEFVPVDETSEFGVVYASDDYIITLTLIDITLVLGIAPLD